MIRNLLFFGITLFFLEAKAQPKDTIDPKYYSNGRTQAAKKRNFFKIQRQIRAANRINIDNCAVHFLDTSDPVDFTVDDTQERADSTINDIKELFPKLRGEFSEKIQYTTAALLNAFEKEKFKLGDGEVGNQFDESGTLIGTIPGIGRGTMFYSIFCIKHKNTWSMRGIIKYFRVEKGQYPALIFYCLMTSDDGSAFIAPEAKAQGLTATRICVHLLHFLRYLRHRDRARVANPRTLITAGKQGYLNETNSYIQILH